MPEEGNFDVKAQCLGQLNKNAKEFQPMSLVKKLNAEAPEFVPGKSKSGNSALNPTQLNLIKLIRTSGANGLFVDEIPDKYREKYHVPIEDQDLSKLLDTITQYVHVMLAGKSDPKRSHTPTDREQRFTLGHHKGRRVVDQYIYTMGEGVEEFRNMIVRVIREFCVRNMTRSDHPLTLATKGLLPAGAHGVVRPTGLALSLFAAEWDRYFNGAEDFKSLREKYNVQKLMPFLLAIPELDIVGTHPEVRVRMRCMDECLEEAEKRAQTCTPEEISAMQSGAEKVDVPNDATVSNPSRKISIDVADGGSEKKSNEFHPQSCSMEQSLHYFQQQYAVHAAMAAQAAHYQALRAGSSLSESPVAQAHAHAAMKFHYYQHMMQAAAASMAHTHVAAGGSIPITSEFFPTATSDSPYASGNVLARLPRKLREEQTQFPPLPATNNSAYNPLAAKIQLMKSMNGSRSIPSASVSRPPVPLVPQSKGNSPVASMAHNHSKPACHTPNLFGERSCSGSGPNSASKGSCAGVAGLSGGLKLTPVASESPLAPGLASDRDVDITQSQLADFAKFGIGLFDHNSSNSFFPGPEACQTLGLLSQGGQGKNEDTTAAVTPVPLSVNPSSSESQHMSVPKLSPDKTGNIPTSHPLKVQEIHCRTEDQNGSLFPIVEPLNPDQHSATSYLQEILKIMKEPLDSQTVDPNFVADLTQTCLVGGELPVQHVDPETEVDSEAAARILLNIFQQQSAGSMPQLPLEEATPNLPSSGITSQDPENLVCSLLGHLMGEDTSKMRPSPGHAASPELNFDAEAVDRLIGETKTGHGTPLIGTNGEYDRLTMLLIRAQMKNQLQEPPPELKTLKTAYDPQYLRMKRPVAKAES